MLINLVQVSSACDTLFCTIFLYKFIAQNRTQLTTKSELLYITDNDALTRVLTTASSL